MSTRNNLIAGIAVAVLLSAAPAAPDGISAGQVLGVDGINNGGAASSAPSSGSALLLEDGVSILLLEDGTSSLCLESGC